MKKPTVRIERSVLNLQLRYSLIDNYCVIKIGMDVTQQGAIDQLMVLTHFMFTP